MKNTSRSFFMVIAFQKIENSKYRSSGFIWFKHLLNVCHKKQISFETTIYTQIPHHQVYKFITKSKISRLVCLALHELINKYSNCKSFMLLKWFFFLATSIFLFLMWFENWCKNKCSNNLFLFLIRSFPTIWCCRNLFPEGYSKKISNSDRIAL